MTFFGRWGTIFFSFLLSPNVLKIQAVYSLSSHTPFLVSSPSLSLASSPCVVLKLICRGPQWSPKHQIQEHSLGDLLFGLQPPEEWARPFSEADRHCLPEALGFRSSFSTSLTTPHHFGFTDFTFLCLILKCRHFSGICLQPSSLLLCKLPQEYFSHSMAFIILSRWMTKIHL